jgi:hypothetical protein
MEPSTPPASMSLTRSWTFQQPSRISSKAVGSMPYSSLGRPATALRPMLGMVAPSNTQTSSPASLRSTRGKRSFHLAGVWSANMSGGSTRWSSTLIRIRSSACMVGAPYRLESKCTVARTRSWNEP